MALFYWLGFSPNQSDRKEPSLESGGVLNSQGVNIEYEIKDKPVAKVTAPTPSLNRPQDNKEGVRVIVSNLKKDPTLFGEWLNLGLYRMQFEDYEGSLEAFRYAALLRPDDARPLSNQANLYGYYLKNMVKAEEMYLAAIKLEPSFLNLYLDAYQFYRDVLKDKAKAIQIIKEGLVANPKDIDLQNLLKEASI